MMEQPKPSRQGTGGFYLSRVNLKYSKGLFKSVVPKVISAITQIKVAIISYYPVI